MTAPYAQRMVSYPNREEWLASRKDFIGASEVAACLGLSSFKDATPFRVWQSRAQPDQVEPVDVQRQKDLNRGNRAEAAILGEFADEHPELIIKPMQHTVVAHPVHEVIRCTPDALIWPHGDLDRLAVSTDPIALVDAKFVEVWRKKEYGPAGTDEMPADYVIQGLIQCECLEAEACHFAVWFGRWEYREFVVRRNPTVAEALIQQTLDWWDQYVVAKRYPPLDESDAAKNFVRDIYPQARAGVLKAPTEEVLEWAKRREEAAAQEKHWKSVKQGFQTRIEDFCGDAEGIEGVCTWKNEKGRVSWKGVAVDMAQAFGMDPMSNSYTAHHTPSVGNRKYHSKLEQAE